MFLGRYNSLYSSFLLIVSRLEEVVKNLVSERGSSERAHQAQISLLVNIHERELEARDRQIAHLMEFNERLLRIGGIPPLAEQQQEVSRPTQAAEPQATTIGGSIIERDKKRTLDYREFCIARAQARNV